MRLDIAFQTLGCKLNQLETEALASSFEESGASIVPAQSDHDIDLYVLNTCTVTGKAEQKARRALRAVVAKHPFTVVLATGCYAQLESATLESLHERVVAVRGEAKDAILELPRWLSERWQGHGDLLEAVREWKTETLSPARTVDPFAFHPKSFSFHSRPALKVQDGCDNRCSYCRVCIARGPSRSLNSEEALSRARSLEAAHRAEAVLTGVNLSQYRYGSLRFPDLLAVMLEGTSRISFRISSYEPDAIDGAFISVFSHERVRPHAHLPVQSGSDSVLSRMARSYRRDRVLAAIEALRRAKGDLFLAADLIVGFPGETDADFADTLDLCRRAGFGWIHAFPFSARPGTRAFELRPRIPERVAGERVAELTALARAGRRDYTQRWIGSEVEAVLEGGLESDDEAADPSDRRDTDAGKVGKASASAPVSNGPARANVRLGTSANYLKLRIEGVPPELSAGTAVRCRLAGGLAFGETGFDAFARFV